VLVSKDGTDHIEIVDASSGQVTNLTTGNTVGYISVDPSNSVANSAFAVYVDGSQYLTVDSTGNVGIGITTPARLLDLETTTANESYLRISGSAGNVADTNFAGIEFYNLDSSAAGPNVASFIEARAETSTGAGGELVFATLPSTASEGARAIERLRIDASGNVGIGGTPTSPLHVFGDARLEEASPTITLVDTTDSSTHLVQSINTALNIQGAGQVRISTSATERIRIDADGNVGIGTTDPNTTLHVSSTTTTKSVVETTGASSDALIEFTKGQGSGNTWSMGIDHSNSQLNLQERR
jgi:hypothetical protein